MKIIDLLNKMANGEEVPKKIRIDHWCYKFEWKDYVGNYIDEDEDIDLMSVLSCDKEELNYVVHEIEEEKKIPEKIKDKYCSQISKVELAQKYNEIIDYLKSKGE